MALEQTPENLKKAYCESLACTGIGAAVNHCDGLFPQEVLVVVPQDQHDDYPEKLLLCVNQVCTKEPYVWTVDQIQPVINAGATFQDLFDNWFNEIIW
ncbi:MAG: hypothetical protein ACE5HS_14455 [bacterium]